MQLQRALRTALIAAPLLVAGVTGTHATSPAPAGAPAAPDVVPREQALGAYLAGTVAGGLGDTATAADLLLDALAHDPKEPALLQPAFLFSTLAGRDTASARLAAQAEPNLVALLVMANDAARHGDWTEAARRFAGLPPSPLNNLVRPPLLAWAQQGAGQTDLALHTLAAVGSAGPLAGTCALEAASIADLAGRTDAAASLYRTAQAFFPGVNLALVQSFGSFLVRNGHKPEAQSIVHALGEQISILGIIEPGLLASLDKPPIASAQQGLARTYLAIAAMIQDQSGAGKEDAGKEAETFMLRFALDLDPSLSSARLMMAELLAPDQPEAAIAVLAKIPAGDPFAPLGDLRTATLLARTDHVADSRARLEALVRTYPDRPEPAESLGDVLSDAKLYAPAVVAFDKAIADRRRMTDNMLAGNDWQLLFARANALDRENQWTEAHTDLEHALALAPDEPFVLNYLGYSMVERHQDLNRARNLIQRALDAKPDDGSIRDSLGWAMLRQDDVPGAVHTLERAAEQMPEDPTVNAHLGSAYWAAGRKIEAEDQWRWALALHPEPQDEATIRGLLKQAGVVMPEAVGVSMPVAAGVSAPAAH